MSRGRVAWALGAMLLAAGVGGCYRAHATTDPAADGGPLSPPALCAATGGSWREGPCCPTRCGLECVLGCVAANCRCPDDRVWDGERGCVSSPECSR